MINTANLSDCNPNILQFADIWQSLRKEGDVPSRADFDPTVMPRLMPNLIMHQIVDRQKMIIRLAGTALRARYGEEITGKDYLDLVPPERRDGALKAVLSAIDMPCGLLVRNVVRSTQGRVVKTEALGLPFESTTGGVDRYLYLSAESEPIGFKTPEAGESAIFMESDRRFIDIGFGTPEAA